MNISVHITLVMAQFCFASIAVAGRYAKAEHIGPNAVVLTRVFGGLLWFYLWTRRRGGFVVERRDWPLLFVCALLGAVINMELFVNGLYRSTATNASVLGATIPVFATLFAVLLGREAPKLLRILGVGLALAGALTLIGVENVSANRRYLFGNVLVLINCCSYALFLVLVRPLAQKYSPMVLTSALFACALPMVLPLGLPEWIEMAPNLSWRGAVLLVFIVAVPTVAAYGLTQAALRRVESSLVASYIYLQPVFATLGATLLLDERPGPRTGLAALLIFAGVFLSTRAQARAKNDRPGV